MWGWWGDPLGNSNVSIWKIGLPLPQKKIIPLTTPRDRLYNRWWSDPYAGRRMIYTCASTEKKMRKFFVFHNITYKRKSLIVVISRREMNAMYFLFFFRFQWRQFYRTRRFARLYEGNTTIINSFVGLSIFLVDFHYNNVYFKELT